MDDATFELSALQIALLRELAVTWQAAEVGAPSVEPAAPYGSPDLLADLRRIAKEAGEERDEEALLRIHRQMDTVLSIALSAGPAPGTYPYPDRAGFLASTGQTSLSTLDVRRPSSSADSGGGGFFSLFRILFRARRQARPGVGSGVQQRSFTVTEEHLALLDGLSVEWKERVEPTFVVGENVPMKDALREILEKGELVGVPAFDPKRPYGTTDLSGDIAEALGLSRELPEGADEDEDWDDQRYTPEQQQHFQQLHEDLQTVIQVIAVHASLEPGTYAKIDRPQGELGWRWERVESEDS